MQGRKMVAKMINGIEVEHSTMAAKNKTGFMLMTHKACEANN
jgi:hypothetical protein